jgi:hypothetical protein
MGVYRVISDADFAYAIKLCGSISGCLDAFTGNQHVNITTNRFGSSHHMGGRARQLTFMEVGKYQNAHEISSY